MFRDVKGSQIVFSLTLSVDTPDVEDGDELVVGLHLVNTYDEAVITPPDPTGWAETWELAVQDSTGAPEHGGYVYRTKVTDASSAPATLDFTTDSSFITNLCAASYSDLGDLEDVSSQGDFSFAFEAPSVDAVNDDSTLIVVLGGGGDTTPDTPSGMTLRDDGVENECTIWDETVDTGATGTRGASISGGQWVAFALVYSPAGGAVVQPDSLFFGSTA